MDNLIDKLRESDNELIKAEVKAAEKWGKLKHTKNDLELLLTYNIAEIRFKPEKDKDYINLIITSNKRFIKIFSAAKKKDKLKLIRTPFNGIKTKDKLSVLSYDLIDGKYKTISLSSWQIINFMPITEENILILDQLVKDCLSKK